MSLDYLGYELKELKATDDNGGGVFSGYASTWEKDLYDDVVVKGAFAQTLSADFKAGGAGIPIHWQHKDGSPNDVIGETLSAVEDEHGLLITAQLDTDIAEGKRAYDLLKRGLIHQMSIGFIAEKTAWVEDEESKSPWDGYREIRQLKLFEISLVQVAANQGAEVLEVKAGRAISKANETATTVVDLAQKFDIIKVEKPIGVVHHLSLALAEVDKTLHLASEALGVVIDILAGEHLSHVGASRGVAYHCSAAADKSYRLVASHLQSLHERKSHEMTCREAVCGAVKTNIECSFAAVYHLSDFRLVRHLRDKSARDEFFVNSHSYFSFHS